ncbi:MAG: lipopolysaccharide core biosynthesis protein [Gammaproteobacteria bacterium]|nr:lipopolysaccharide core biosynthesis protein [Gammaproteobacteria bacterium]MBU2154868.1 lipopolysaccharide core biosynthesis protein [Gammaproteobacteria bacterium]MBU2255651.1 lipopolysaccharide core biosynthesis protein [Gammaproteobacteria bacterium]MBU2296531.1 lipopolysaccharide core biosynthesis protein [Gammaproteobacteria bacterium]
MSALNAVAGEMGAGVDEISLHAFSACKGTRSGPLFIVASGPSARDFPLASYAQYPMFAVSGSIQLFTTAGVAPLFYLCDDNSFATQRQPILRQGLALAQNVALSPRVIRITQGLSAAELSQARLYAFNRVNRSIDGKQQLSDRRFAWKVRNDQDVSCAFSLFSQKPNRIGFSRDMDKGYFSCRTIPYAGLQLAHHLGFNQVILVGVDLDSSQGRFYEQGAAAMPSRLDGDYEDYIEPCFKLMAQRVVGPTFQVYNLSAKSRLPASLVPKITLDQLDTLLASA